MATAQDGILPGSSSNAPVAGPMEEFYSLLTKLLQAFYGKDPYGFFYEPVDVSVVTDYLNIIKQPMDFGTMGKKIAHQEYTTLREFQSDFELICSNCMIYNAPNTVYYKTAQKLLHFGRKLISKEAQKANTLLILSVATEPSGGLAIDKDTLGDFSAGSLSHLKRKAEVALFKKLHDGSALFTSLKKYRGPVSFSTHADGSLDLSEYTDLEQMMIMPLTEDMVSKKYAESLSKLGSTGNILAGFVTRTQNPKLSAGGPGQANLATGSPYSFYSLDYLPSKPFYSFSPFYDSQGFPIPSFDSAGLSLAYGDPKGRAYIESLERFLVNTDSLIESGTSDQTGGSAEFDLLNELSCDGHAYVKTVYQWRKKIKEQQHVSQKETGSDGSMAIEAEDNKLDTKSIQEPPLLRQVKSDLNLLARILRWKKVEPEIDRLDRLSPIQLIRQFQHQLISSKREDELDKDSNEQLTSNDAALIQVSKILLKLQSFQNERFKMGKPAAISQEERDLGIVSPHQLLHGSSLDSKMAPIHAAMTSLREDRPLPLFQGSLEKHE